MTDVFIALGWGIFGAIILSSFAFMWGYMSRKGSFWAEDQQAEKMARVLQEIGVDADKLIKKINSSRRRK